MNKYTPAPWTLACGVPGRFILMNYRNIDDPDGKIHNANAHLITTAPELQETGYTLAMLCLQSKRYVNDTDFREAVDNHLAIQTKLQRGE